MTGNPRVEVVKRSERWAAGGRKINNPDVGKSARTGQHDHCPLPACSLCSLFVALESQRKLTCLQLGGGLIR